MAVKEVTGMVKLVVPAGAATPAPPVGPALGQAGINISEFVKQFNDKSSKFEKNTPIPTIISVYKDRSFSFEMKLPPVSYLIKKELGLEKASANPGTVKVAKINMTQIRKIAEEKMPDLNSFNIESAMKIVAGQCVSMGIDVKGEL
ncbi:MAG: 50S ribosomal protein L11 [Alphaproteobacteria bacterium]|nr:50S ribosomal protein L11 [Alphaproteobacteria bacterium]MBL0717788.1 50S ribosomal protein L11 [Alphaproteobacteria bacterium]